MESLFDESDTFLCARQKHTQHSKRCHYTYESPTRMCRHVLRVALQRCTLRNRIYHSANPVLLFHLPVQ